MNYVKQKFLKALAWKNVTISKVYPAYRKWFNTTTKKPETFKLIDWVWNEEKWVDWVRTLVKWEPSFKVHKKVYDIVVKLDSPEYITVVKYDKESKTNVEMEIYWDEFTFNEVGAGKIRDIAEATVAFWRVPTKDDWTPAYDWEDTFIDQLSWVSIVFSTKNVKKPIWDKEVEFAEFTFREGKWKKVESSDDDLPF